MSKLNIKEEMRAIEAKDRRWYDSLTEEEKGKLGMWLLMRYTSSAGEKMFQEHYLEWTNEVVNVHFNKLRKHPITMATFTVGWTCKPTYHWSKAGKVTKLQKWVQENYPHLNDDEVDIFIGVRNKEDFIELFEEYGLDKKQIKDILK